ncbi:MAG: hypothetical protein ACOYEV_10505 [Candidatus Nanopelagicales bacterium]
MTEDQAPAPEDDQSCLLFGGADAASSGRYWPRAYELRLRGDNLAQHHVTHLHEIHHKVLNDDTAWGALIHIAARHPGWEGLLDQLVGSSRIVHEAFASFMAVSLAEQRHSDIRSVLDDYPVYRPLVDRMRRLLARVPPGHRQDLAATGIARLCMSSPVLDLAADRYPEMLSLADILSTWLPDQRFAIISGAPARSIQSACEAADTEFAGTHGRPVDDLSLAETDELLDEAWATWEYSFVAHLQAAEPRIGALPQVGANDHLVAATKLAHMAAARGITLPLPHASAENTVSDAESVQRLFTATELTLRERWPAVLAELGRGVAAEPVLALSAAGPRPFLIVHGRTAAHLGEAFEFGARDRAALLNRDEPIFAVRLLIDDDGQDLILNATVPSAAAYQDLMRGWPDEHVAANCITASCFLRGEWQPHWVPALHAKPTVVLLDTGLLTMVGERSLLGASGTIHGIHMELEDPAIKALAWHVEGHPHVMLAIGDDLTVQLIAGQLADLVGDRLRMRDSDWSAWVPTLSAVCASVLGTEHSLRYDGMGRA